MAKKTDAYIDTSAFIAFLDRSDSYHSLFKALFSNPPKLITTTLVIAEGHGWFLKRYDQHRALQFLSFIEELKVLSIKPVGQKDVVQAAKHIKKFKDQSLTLADAVGLNMMAENKILQCWSTDRHLSLTGVPLVIY